MADLSSLPVTIFVPSSAMYGSTTNGADPQQVETTRFAKKRHDVAGCFFGLRKVIAKFFGLFLKKGEEYYD